MSIHTFINKDYTDILMHVPTSMNMCMVFSRNDGLAYVLKGIESKQSSMAPKLALPE